MTQPQLDAKKVDRFWACVEQALNTYDSLAPKAGFPHTSVFEQRKRGSRLQVGYVCGFILGILATNWGIGAMFGFNKESPWGLFAAICQSASVGCEMYSAGQDKDAPGGCTACCTSCSIITFAWGVFWPIGLLLVGGALGAGFTGMSMGDGGRGLKIAFEIMEAFFNKNKR